MEAPQKLKLTYIDMRSIAESIRLAFYVGKIPFEDNRVSYDEVAAMRSTGELPCGQVPILECDGEVFCQTNALLRLAGNVSGLYPSGDLKLQCRCDMIEEALADIKGTLKPLWYKHVVCRTPPESIHMVPLTAEQVDATKKALNEKTLPLRFQQLETLLEASGGPYFCGSKMTICDLSFYVLASGLRDGSFVDGITASVLDRCTALLALEQLIRHHPRVHEWEQTHDQDPYAPKK